MITIIKIISYLFILESLFVLFLSLENDRNNAKKCMPNLSKLNQILLEFNIELRFSKIEVVNFILIIFLNLDNFGAVLKDDFSDAEQRRPCVSCSLSSSFRGDFSSQSFVNKIVFYKKCEFLKKNFFKSFLYLYLIKKLHTNC